ncbi:MAG TPA: FAD-dependent thymidylate synthase, partial [bacterium]|nr:FAD-dependent thymidylate synthase [bacterium]
MAQQRQDPHDPLTPAEQELVARYVTSTTEPVFALVNLPEVIKGALFSRYSRSALGLRQLLLKEFIQAPESQFGALAGAPGATPGAQPALALERARDFYNRILDGYGDDSIGELGGAHLALEGVSMLAAKALEDARIGGSPLEKSTRYVSFARRPGGDFPFYAEPTLLASPHRERYLGLCRALFTAYEELYEPLHAHLQASSARPADVGEAAWKRALRAATYDALRGLLPAATLTNLGLYGNGRFFEALLVRLQAEPLAELRSLAQGMLRELAKVMDSFVWRAQPGNAHFAGHQAYRQELAQGLRDLARAAFPQGNGRGASPAAIHAGPEVSLLDCDGQAEEKVLAALAYETGSQSLAEGRSWAACLTPAQREGFMAHLAGL